MRFFLAASLCFLGWAQAREVPSFSKLPDLPENYSLRDWKKTARDFDALVFDENRTGQFLPLIWKDSARLVNDAIGFGIPTYVGDSRQNSKNNVHEAITGMASVLNGTLIGIDKSKYAPQLSSHFHKKNGVGLYLNQAGTTGDSYWYDLLPSLLFAHLYSHYPDTIGYEAQFLSTIRRWEEIARQLDNDFDHTGYDFHTQKPVDRGWSEADVVAGLACLQYLGWKKTKRTSHLRMAERCLRWMDQRENNPYYESLAPYGAYASAVYNAENDGSHKTGKFIEWVLAGDNPRKWGAMLETWNNVPVHGLIGSVYPSYEYAFAMNTFQAVGIMTPIARYEERFARDLAKWVLNVAANARYFYPDAWPTEKQTSYEWARENDPDFCIPYEGIRKQGKVRRYPEEDRMKVGLLRLGESTNPDKDIFLTANEKGKIHYEGVIELPGGDHHTLIAVVINRRIQNEVRLFIRGKKGKEINFLNQTRDDQTIPFSGGGKIVVVLKADNLKPGEVVQVQDIVVETRLPDPPHVGGDATIHGWGNTDLGLYGGSNVGFLASLVEPTNVEGILAIDPVITDISKPVAFPTRIFFNPHPTPQSVDWNLGKEAVRVYDALSNQVLHQRASGLTTIEIPARKALMLVFTPASKSIKVAKGNLVCDGVVIDFQP